MNSLTRLTGTVFVLALAGCALPGNEMAEYRKRIIAEHQAQNGAMTTRVQSQPLPLDTTLRLGSSAVLLVNVPAAGIEPETQARLFANCSSLTLAMDYRQAKGWSSPFVLPADPNQTAQAMARQMCQTVQDSGWRQLPADGEDTVLLDPGTLGLNSAQRSIWAGIDYARLRLDENENKPYDRQFERVEINCATRQASTRLTYRLSDQGLLPPPGQPLDSAFDAAQRTRLIDAVCAEPSHLTKLATPGPLRKKLPPNLPTPQVAAALLAQVSALPQGQPTNTLSHLQLTYDATSPMAPSAVIKDTPVDLYLQPGPARGIWREQATGALGSPQVSVRWRGLIELATTSDTGLDGKPAQASRLTNIDLVGDWQNLKPGNALGYSKTLTPSTGKPFVQKFECSVGESAPAAQHVASLQGLARNVTCSADNGLKSSSTYLYLEAYDLFVETAERSMLLVQVKKLKAAE